MIIHPTPRMKLIYPSLCQNYHLKCCLLRTIKFKPMISGIHTIIYSQDAEADKAFLRDLLKLRYVDAGHGWLIFALPPSELAVHPSETSQHHELYLMTDDIHAFILHMKEHNIRCGNVREERWGLVTALSLPGGGKMGVYQPKHARPEPLG